MKCHLDFVKYLPVVIKYIIKGLKRSTPSAPVRKMPRPNYAYCAPLNSIRVLYCDETSLVAERHEKPRNRRGSGSHIILYIIQNKIQYTYLSNT